MDGEGIEGGDSYKTKGTSLEIFHLGRGKGDTLSKSSHPGNYQLLNSMQKQ